MYARTHAREREREGGGREERERERECVCVCWRVCVHTCARTCVCVEACSYILKDKQCNPLFVAMDTSCELDFKRDNVL